MLLKEASKPVATTAFSGELIKSKSGWIMLTVPNMMVRGLFLALDVPGAELPLRDGKLNAHISVIRPEELEQIGGKIDETGKRFKFQIGRLKEVRPVGWDEMDKVWMVEATSPELSKLRRSYGLPSKPHRGKRELEFHITIAVRRRGVLRGEVSKTAAELPDEQHFFLVG